MPFATFSRIREVSSEDNQHLAANLITMKPGRKWKTQNAGEKSAYVILEMDEAQQITGIDIGNEHSAFVEVLVGKSNCVPSDFKEILITCSFMTPIESRSSNNANRVRCFNDAALVPTTAEKKWSLVKVICTQPFNNHVQYGLSFIKVHVAQNQSVIVNNKPAHQQNELVSCSGSDKTGALHIGQFKLREDSLDSDSEGASNLFNRWKKSKDEKCEQTAAASIRSASNAAVSQAATISSFQNSKTSQSNESLEIPDRNRDTLLFGDDKEDIDTEKESRLTKKIDADKKRRLLEIQKQSENKRRPIDIKRHNESNNSEKDTANHTQNTSNSSTTSTKAVDSVKKRYSSPHAERPSKKEKRSAIRYKPFNELLKGVVLVISGIQNPDRADLRTKALALGAKYKSDWDNTCTHLICAFKNTPKYNQVRGKGKIITRTWIEKCYHLKKYLPWRRYALDSNELTKPESDEEILDDSLEPNNTLNHPQTSRKEVDNRNHTLSLYDLGELPPAVSHKKHVFETSSGSDTDEEIQRIERRKTIKESESQQKKPKTIKEGLKDHAGKVFSISSTDVYDLPTDEEDYLRDKTEQVKPNIVIS